MAYFTKRDCKIWKYEFKCVVSLQCVYDRRNAISYVKEKRYE